MTGICGIAGVQRNNDSLLFESMLDRLRHAPWHHVEEAADSANAWAFGRVSLGISNTAPQPVVLRDGSSAVMQGELLDADVLRQAVHSGGVGPCGQSHAEILLRGYLEQGKRFFVGLNGKFSAALWDARSQQLVLVNDRFGMQPLYFAVGKGRLTFASEIKALLCDPELSRRQNVRGIAQFLTFGHLWGEETFYESVRVLPAGSCLVYDAATHEVTCESHTEFAPPQSFPGGDRRELLERIDTAFSNAVRLRVQETSNLGLSLSGGLDARTILGVIDPEVARPTCVCLGMPGSRDQRYARQMAATAGCEYHDYFLNDRFLGEFEQHLHRMVELTDGHYLSQCIVMPTLSYLRELGIKVLLRGHAGELMHLRKAYNFSLNQSAMSLEGEADLREWLYGHLRSYMLEGVDGPLLAECDAREVEALARESIDEALAPTSDWSRPVDRISHLFITQRLRRETSMSLVKFGSVVETRLPYLDPEVVDALWAAPADLKLDEEIQAYILQKRRPAFLQITNVNTGARMGAGPLNRRWNHLKMRVLAKLGAPGYQPYERLGLWLRRELRPLVERLLLDDRSLSRGVFVPETVRKVVRRHLDGSRNHTFLVMALMIFELGQRKFADADGDVAEMTLRSGRG